MWTSLLAIGQAPKRLSSGCNALQRKPIPGMVFVYNCLCGVVSHGHSPVLASGAWDDAGYVKQVANFGNTLSTQESSHSTGFSGGPSGHSSGEQHTP